jgi:hypothetical protein
MEKAESSIARMMAGLDFHPGRGLLVLELQEKVLSFLHQCAKRILHDLMPMTTAQCSSISPPPLVTPVPTDVGWHSVATMSAEAPYRVPIQFDFTRLQSLVKAKRDEAEDHIWLLREDPGYFRDIVGELSEHRPERLPYESGRVDLGDRFWGVVFGRSMLADAYSNLWIWHLVSKHIEKVARLREYYGERIAPRRKLPIEYEEALLHFSHVMVEIRNLPLHLFRHRIFASPALRRHFYRVREGDPAHVSVGRKHEGRKDYFIWLIEQLCEEETLLKLGPKNILDELERVVRDDSESQGTPQKDRLSSHISNILSDVAVAMEVDEAVANHRPNVGFLHTLPAKTLNDGRQKDLRPLRDIQDEIMDDVFERKLDTAGYPLSKFDYPSDKPRTASTTEKMRIAEQNLDQLWDIVDTHFLQRTGKTIHELLSAAKLKPRELERTPQWIDPIAQLPTAAQASTTPALPNFDVHDLEERTRVQGIGEPPEPKSKVKTRGVAREPAIEVEEPISAPLLNTPQTISVSNRAYATFSILFHNPSNNKQLPGEIPWTDFLHALSSTGFSIEKQTGSAWLFVPPSTIRSTPIIFHEPHPSSKVPFHIARRHGRRLARTYGWNSDTFVIA